MATGEEKVTLDGLKAVYDHVNGDITGLYNNVKPVELSGSTLLKVAKLNTDSGNENESDNRLCSVAYMLKDDGYLNIKCDAGYSMQLYGWAGSTFIGRWLVTNNTWFSTGTTPGALWQTEFSLAVPWATGNVTRMKICVRKGDGASSDKTYMSDAEHITFKKNDAVYPSFEYVDAIAENVDNYKRIDYWGDSQTVGTGGGSSTPFQLMRAYLPDEYTFQVCAAGGESANTVACRQGALRFIVQPGVTIPASGSVEINAAHLKDEFGRTINIRNTANDHINPVTIAGVEGNIVSNYQDVDSAANYVYTFTRTTAGEAVVIDRPTAMVTASSKYSRHIAIMMVGQNQMPNQTTEGLIQLYRHMIEKNGNDHYLIIGLTTPGRQDLNAALHEAFGRHFIDLRSYLIAYGLADNGLTPTAEDTAAIENDNVPPSLLSDSVHGNQYWYKTRNKLEIERGREFGWWA